MEKTLGRFTNDTTQAVAANGNILFTNNTFTNCSLGYDGNGGIQIKSPGTYMIYANFLDVATAIGDVTISMYEDGTIVPSAIAGGTLAAVGDYCSLGINAIVTVKSILPNTYATITFEPSTATSFNAATVIVEKVA